MELKGSEAVVKKPQPDAGGYVDCYIRTRARKLSSEIDLKRVIEEEALERFVLSRRYRLHLSRNLR